MYFADFTMRIHKFIVCADKNNSEMHSCLTTCKNYAQEVEKMYIQLKLQGFFFKANTCIYSNENLAKSLELISIHSFKKKKKSHEIF